MAEMNNNNNHNNNSNNILNWNLIEEKWRHRWEDKKIFHTDPDFTKKKYFITVAYPYPNSPQHIGHGRTYTLADVHARYMRMRGYNVLFPMGFHYTGTPILAMSRRVASQDKELLSVFHNLYNIPQNVIEGFVKPVNIAKYFHNEIKLGMKEMGYSIDWRREFTTIDEAYSKLISWQFRVLKSKRLIVQGSHPVGWCPNDQNPVSQHDTIGDVEPDFVEYTLIKFRLEDNEYYIIPTATLRPETIYGVTNLWVNPKTEYAIISLDDGTEKWIVSNEAAKKLEFLNHKVVVNYTMKGKELVGKYAKNLVTENIIPIYPASFVESDNGTGIVMSVPAHAPFDYQALQDLKYNTLVQDDFNLGTIIVEPISVIESDDFLNSFNVATLQTIKKFGIKNQQDKKLEEATNELYLHEFYKGKMRQNTGKYAGMSVADAKDAIKRDITAKGVADRMFELVNKPVICRCGTNCVVKLLNDQWFLNYGDKKWKELVHKCINKMDIVPEEIRQEFNYVIDWLRERACARKSGLGTKLPWDSDWIIESLSDSVIYMVYYIIAKYINKTNNNEYNTKINSDHLNDSFFDYILLGKGERTLVAKDCDIPVELVEDIRREFSYFYPVDTRHSGRDLVPNHLSFFIFNHVAIFEEKNWPKQIVVNGSVLMEGRKMSKSVGNIIPLRAAIKEHGADAIRIAMLISAELLQDADFTFKAVKGIRSKLYDFYNMALELLSISSRSRIKGEYTNELEDRWLISRLQEAISGVTKSMNRQRVREALHIILYTFDQDLQWYRKRIKAKNRQNTFVANILFSFLSAHIKMLAPFAPFITEEIWEKIGNTLLPSIIFAQWPLEDVGKKDLIAEESEQLIMNLVADIQNIIKVTKIKPVKIIIYTSAQWKSEVYQKIIVSILRENKTNFGDIMKQLVKDPILKSKSDPNLIKKMIQDILSDPLEIRSRRLDLLHFDEITPIKDAATLLSIEGGNAQMQIAVFSEDDPDLPKHDLKSKAKFARPFKPAIYMVE